MLIRKPLYLMTAVEGAGEGSEGAAVDGGAGGADQKAAEQGDKGKTFTQTDVERIIAGRLSKYSDYDELKQQVANLTPLREQFDTIAKAFGVKGEDDTPPDPQALAAQVTAEQTKAREAAVQLAVYRNATKAGGDPDALIDSASFREAVKDVDPNDAEAIAEAIKAAVAANPRLAANPDIPSAGHVGLGAGSVSGPLDPRVADLAQIERDLAAAKSTR